MVCRISPEPEANICFFSYSPYNIVRILCAIILYEQSHENEK